jgi:hypothetical protein
VAQLREEVELKKLAQDSKLTMTFFLGLSGLEFTVFLRTFSSFLGQRYIMLTYFVFFLNLFKYDMPFFFGFD